MLDILLRRTLELGARQAGPGEFSQRAFLNGKIDLTQAEAIADLIQAATAAQVRLANRSLQGLFSRQVHALVEQLTRMRALLEASLDFPDDELDALPIGDSDFEALMASTETLLASTQQGELIRDGLLVVIAGAPNAGKSSLLNAMTRQSVSIVSDQAGTTTDPVEKPMELLPLGPVLFIDTAGIDDEGALGELRI